MSAMPLARASSGPRNVALHYGGEIMQTILVFFVNVALHVFALAFVAYLIIIPFAATVVLALASAARVIFPVTGEKIWCRIEAWEGRNFYKIVAAIIIAASIASSLWEIL
jgi:hypothetical protein